MALGTFADGLRTPLSAPNPIADLEIILKPPRWLDNTTVLQRDEWLVSRRYLSGESIALVLEDEGDHHEEWVRELQEACAADALPDDS